MQEIVRMPKQVAYSRWRLKDMATWGQNGSINCAYHMAAYFKGYTGVTLTCNKGLNLPLKEVEIKLAEQVVEFLSLRMQKSTAIYPRTLKDLYTYTLNSFGSNDHKKILLHWMSVLAESSFSPLIHKDPWWPITASKQIRAWLYSWTLTEML